MRQLGRKLNIRFLLIMLVTIFATTAFAQSTGKGSQPSTDAQTTQAYKALADVLENPKQRAILIDELRRLSQQEHDEYSQGSNNTEQGNTAEQGSEDDQTIALIANNTKAAVASVFTLPKKVASKSTTIVSEIADKLAYNWRSLKKVFSDDSNLNKRVVSGHFWKAVLNLSLVIAMAVGFYQGTRYFLLKRIKARLNHWVKHRRCYRPIVRRFLGILLTVGMDILCLALAYFLANAIAFYVVGEKAEISTQAALFINAFVIIELLKVGVRVVFYPSYDGLRFLPGSDATARHWYHWLATLLNLIGYGYLVAVPLVEHYLDSALSQAVATVIAVLAFIYGVTMVVRHHRDVCSALHNASDKAHSTTASVFLSVLALLWHWIALAYFVALLVLMLLEAEQGLPFVMHATLYTLLIVGAGLLISSVMTQIIGHRINLSADWRRRVPGLERRINTYIPLILRVVHFVILIAVILGVLASWNLIDLVGWVSSDTAQALIDTWLGAIFILMAAAIIWIVLAGLIEHRLSADTGTGKPSARATTLLSLFKNGLAVVIGIITAMMVLSQIGVDIGPLIAGAGVLGLAIGFGSQKLVQDIITGIFIQLENAMNTGDLVTVDGITGTAEHISIRTVALRDISGTYHIIPFSNVTTVSNYMRGYAYHKAEYGIGYNEDIDAAVEQLEAAFAELAAGEYKQNILEPITVAGVTELADSAVNIRVLIKTTPGDQFAVGRAYNRLVKIYFDRAGIEIPYPHTTLYFGELKDGSAPAANLRITDIASGNASGSNPNDEKDASDEVNEKQHKKGIISKHSNAQTNQPDVDGEL